MPLPTPVRLALALILALPAVAAAAPAPPPPADQATVPGLLRVRSAHSVGKTLDRFEAIAKKKGLTVFARVDHAAGAEKAGLKLPPTQLLIFGNPKIGTPIMQAGPTAAIDLPVKLLAWADAKGGVWMGYNDPAWVAARHGVPADHPAVVKMGKALAALTAKAAE